MSLITNPVISDFLLEPECIHMQKILIGVLLVYALITGPAFGAGNVAAGKAKAKTCAVCHGKRGISKKDLFPNLAGQKARYLFNQMKLYKIGKRWNPIMNKAVKLLSEKDLRDLAAYYSGLGSAQEAQ